MNVTIRPADENLESLPGSRPCQILILSENFAAYEHAAAVCRRILAQLADDLDFGFNCWNVTELSDPESARRANWAARASDVILLSLHRACLPPEVTAWLDAFAGRRLRPEGALALVLNEPPDSPSVLAELVAHLEKSAARAGMDFLSLVQTPENYEG